MTRPDPSWLSADDWKRVQDSVPICCVDVLPIRRNASTSVSHVGLIFRDTPHQGRRWCVVGGRMRRNESMTEAAGRQIRETLGDGMRFTIPTDAFPHYIAEYFTHPRPAGLLDPRQHAIGITFAVEMDGQPIPQGEAADFRWFDVGDFPGQTNSGSGRTGWYWGVCSG